MIRTKSFSHKGGYYFYRLHLDKSEQLCNGFTNLKNYLNSVFHNCPNDYFNSGPRSSCLKFKTDADLIEVKGHKVSSLAEKGLEDNEERFRTAHSRVQVFMLENDNSTIACEVPIWLEHKELDNYEKYFNSKEPLTGHIDLLGVEGNNIWVWDYKPDAKHEKYATTQVFFYSLMLAKRTGIDLDKFRCGYFDHNHAFMFKPKLNMLNKKVLSDF